MNDAQTNPPEDRDSRDRVYTEVLLEPLRRCADYAPRMGQAQTVNYDAFAKLYRADPLYSWFGLDTPLMYTAHKAAGGMTSVYRQLGIGCERLWRRLLIDQLSLTASDATWSYQTPTAAGRRKTLRLDGRIDLDHLGSAPARRDQVERWLGAARGQLEVRTSINGVVFEVRQGYKSKDSKRQQADLDNASHALKNAYIPAIVLFSQQIDDDIALRYRQSNWIVLIGDAQSRHSLESTYAFADEVLAFDLVGFFERVSPLLKAECERILTLLLEPR